MTDRSSAQWLVEQGIGEDRALLLDKEQVTAARLDWPGRLSPGQVEDAVLVARGAGSNRGTARFASGEEALVDGLPGDSAEGASIRLAITRAAIAESGRTKLARARPSRDEPRHAPTLAERLRACACPVQVVRRFPTGLWSEIFAEGWDAAVGFPRGKLTISPTPAMTLIDIDGDQPPLQLALAAVPAIAGAIRRLDLAGSVGIDFPGIASREDRRKVDAALRAALPDWPHESTAMNGFGFVQLVSRLEGPSIVQRIALERAGAAARLLLRRAERIEEPGTLLLSAHPAVRAAVTADWEAELARRSGRTVRWKVDPALALEGAFAQAIAP